MIFITGDTHGVYDKAKLTPEQFTEGASLTKDDYVIIVGDFGGVFGDNIRRFDGSLKENNRDRRLLDWYEHQPFTTLFIDGNHENFISLQQYPEKDWRGGRVHELRPSVLHLERGYIFNIDGRSILTMGGADSVDKGSRKRYIDWWAEELPSKVEYDRCLDVIEGVEHVDVILTHTAPLSIVEHLYETGVILTQSKDERHLNNFLEYLSHELTYDKWFFGHFHLDQSFGNGGKTRCVYQDVIKLEGGSHG